MGLEPIMPVSIGRFSVCYLDHSVTPPCFLNVKQKIPFGRVSEDRQRLLFTLTPPKKDFRLLQYYVAEANVRIQNLEKLMDSSKI